MPDNSGESQRREVRVQCRVLSAFLFICLFIFLLFLLLLLSLLFLLLLSEIRLLSAAPVTRRMGPVVYQRCAAAASGTNVKPTGPHKGNSASAFKVGRARPKLFSFVSLSFLNLLLFGPVAAASTGTTGAWSNISTQWHQETGGTRKSSIHSIPWLLAWFTLSFLD